MDVWLYSAGIGPCHSEDLPDDEVVNQHGEHEESPLVRTRYLSADEEHNRPQHRKTNRATASQLKKKIKPSQRRKGFDKTYNKILAHPTPDNNNKAKKINEKLMKYPIHRTQNTSRVLRASP